MQVEVLQGDHKGKRFAFDTVNSCFTDGISYTVRRYPFSEIQNIQEIDVQDKRTIATLTFASGLTLTLKFKNSNYKLLKEFLLLREEQPQGIELPIEVQDKNFFLTTGITVVIILVVLGAIVVNANKPEYALSSEKKIWHDCMRHPHWDDYRKTHSYLETVGKKAQLCGPEPEF